MIQHDEKKPNDCAKEPHELTHACDALRYACTSYTFVPDKLSGPTNNQPFDYANFALEMGGYEIIDAIEGEDYIDMGWL